MTSAQLAIAIWVLTFGAWVGAAILVYLARGSRVGTLTERAVVGVGIAMFGTIYSLATYNSDIANILPTEAIRFIVRLAVAILLLLPLLWSALYFMGRLGDDGRGGE